MAKKKNKSSNPLMQFLGFVVLPLLALDLYAVWRIHDFTGGWGGLFVNLAEPLNQLGMLLLANFIIMVSLAIISRY